MTRLLSVSLTNIRKFGHNARINFSPGATIILAPNGTGKTAVFEAIELALTGGVARLGSDLSPIIRDEQESASVRVAFEGAERSVQIGRETDPVFEGSLAPVFGNAGAQDLPFLLRLTHLLDQREQGWFVQAEAKAAGSQLAKLPVGRDGVQASTVLTGARRIVKETQNHASTSLHEARLHLSDWEHKLQDRNSSALELERPLTSQSELSTRLASIASDDLGLAASPVTGVTSLLSACANLESVVEQRKSQVEDRLFALSNIQSTVGAFDADRERFNRLQADVERARSKTNEPRDLLEKASVDISRVENRRQQLEASRQRVTQQIRYINEVAQAKADLETKAEAVRSVDAAMIEARKVLSSYREDLQGIERIAKTHEALRAKQDGVRKLEAEIDEAEKLVEKWELSLSILDRDEKESGALDILFQERGKSYQQMVASHAHIERGVLEAKAVFESLNSTTDALRQAVAVIAAQLPVERADCPVCGVLHGPAELQMRLRNSLESIDPSLALADRAHREKLDQLRAVEKSLSDARESLHAVRASIATIEHRRSSLSTDVDTLRAHPLLSADTVDQAMVEIQARREEARAARNSLTTEYATTAPQPSIQESTEINSLVEVAAATFERTRDQLALAKSQYAQAVATYSGTATQQDPARPLEELLHEIASVQRELGEFDEQIAAHAVSAERYRDALKQAEDLLRDSENQLDITRARLGASRSQWANLGLPGDPSAEILSAVVSQVGTERSQIDRSREQLTIVNGELARWKATEENRRAQAEVDRKRGASSETEFTQSLEARVGKHSEEVHRISMVSQALDTLSTSLAAEIGDIHDRVVAVVPRWQALLRRVVRDQRFAKTELDFYSHYKKEHAEVRVPLHGGVVPVPSIASEAQMTDLQLTFLLAMAVNHSWSPWRGLLLDDPTQHHDLVHSSAVFDVLRDYISDHKFQVVIATHDALQARFLMRKLQNDGLPSSLWTLIPTESGVVASATHS